MSTARGRSPFPLPLAILASVFWIVCAFISGANHYHSHDFLIHTPPGVGLAAVAESVALADSLIGTVAIMGVWWVVRLIESRRRTAD